MLLINCEINLILTWYDNCVIYSANEKTKLKITDTELYVPCVTLSIQDNAKLLEQLKSGFKRTIDWNKYQTKVLIERQNQYLGFLIDPRFHRVNRLSVLLFENQGDRMVHTGYSLAKVEVKDYNVMIDGKNFFDQPVKSDLRTYDNVWNISTGQGDDYTAGCLLDYNYFTKYYKMRAIYLSNQQVVDSDAKSIQQINFTGNIENQSTIIFIIEEAEETVLDFSQGTVKLVLILFFALI